MKPNFFYYVSGSVIVFVAILSMGFLDGKLSAVKWIGIVFVLSGLSVVGLSDFMSGTSSAHMDTNSIITGKYSVQVIKI